MRKYILGIITAIAITPSVSTAGGYVAPIIDFLPMTPTPTIATPSAVEFNPWMVVGGLLVIMLLVQDPNDKDYQPSPVIPIEPEPEPAPTPVPLNSSFWFLLLAILSMLVYALNHYVKTNCLTPIKPWTLDGCGWVGHDNELQNEKYLKTAIFQ